MAVSGHFVFEGDYRVQSKSRSMPSRIEGHWIGAAEGAADCSSVNRRIRRHPFWQGQHVINLTAAAVRRRHGAFADHPDILYKLSHFVPAPGTSAMGTNIVDVNKAARNWRTRRRYLAALLGRHAAKELEDRIGSIRSVAASEYMVHEAGHCLGAATEDKYRAGYFRYGGATLWQLVHLEEYRADLLSFGFAADTFSPSEATSIFLYNVLLRLGVDLEARAAGNVPPYGPIPVLLFSHLFATGAIALGDDGIPLRFVVKLPEDVVEVMRSCSQHALEELVEPEMTNGSLLDAALSAARYYGRHRSLAEASPFGIACSKALARLQ